MENTTENIEKQPVLPNSDKENTEKKLPSTATFTVRMDRKSYDRLMVESEERNLSLSPYCASMIRECWQHRDNQVQQEPAKFKGVPMESVPLAYLRNKYPKYTDRQLTIAALFNIQQNEKALIFVTDFETTLKNLFKNES